MFTLNYMPQSNLFKPEEIYEAKAFAKLCYDGKRWLGNALLIIMDACFDSIGLNYFTVVFNKTKTFYEKYVKTGVIKNCKDFLNKNGETKAKELIHNTRAIKCLTEICKILAKQQNEFNWLRNWAEKADINSYKEDILGRINGVGINTFQYLRMQVGVDTIMPDKIIIKWLNERAKLNVKNEKEAIRKGHEFATSIGLKDTELCWAIWIAESKELGKIEIM